MESLLWIAVIGAALACPCPSSWVSVTQIGDGVCDPECMSQLCSYDTRNAGISDCELACQAAGCDLSLLGNGVCDPGCETQVCGWDYGDCGACEPNCSLDELENSECDSACNSPTCNWDFEACECAPGCSESLRLSSTPYLLCCSSQCQYQSHNSVCMEESCAADCQNSYINDGVCDEACFTAACEWDGADCYCASGCAPSMQGNGECDSECANESCGFDNGDCDVEVRYVGEVEGSDGSGLNSANPASSLTDILSQLQQSVGTVYLLNGVFPLTIPKVTTNLQDTLQPLSRISPFSQPSSLLITTFLCTGLNTPLHCASSLSTIHLTSSHIHFIISNELILKDVIISGAVSLRNDCAECTYCPYIRLHKGVLVDDQDYEVNANQWPDASACNEYQDFSLFIVKGKLTVENVEFHTFRMQPRALMELQGGSIVLNSVDFTSITPAMTASPSAVILQKHAYPGGSLSYTSGKVSLLNDRNEYRPDLQLHGFLDMDGLTSLRIYSVEFTYNVVLSNNTAALLRIGNVKNVEIYQCEFRWNLVKDGLIFVNSVRIPYKSDYIRQGKMMDSYEIMINFTNVTIENNYAENAVLRWRYAVNMHSVVLNNVHFQANTGGSLVDIELKGPLQPGFVTEKTYSNRNPNLVSSRFISLSFISAVSNYCSKDLISLINLPNLSLSSLFLDDNSDMGYIGPNEVVIPYFRAQRCYLSMDLPVVYSQKCGHGVNLRNITNMEFGGSYVDNSQCEYGGLDVYIDSCKGDIRIFNLSFTDNTGNSVNSTTLNIINTDEITIFKLTQTSNQNYALAGSAGLHSSSSQIRLSNSLFEGNVASQGSAILIQSNTRITITDTDFSANTASTGGAIAAFDMNGFIKILNCGFWKNTVKMNGGGIALISGKVQLVMENVNMGYNKAIGNGAALYVAEDLEVQEPSIVNQTVFVSNAASGFGTVYLIHATGKLTVSECRFTTNSAKSAPALYIQSTTVLTELDILENTGESVLILNKPTVSTGLNIRYSSGRAVTCTSQWTDSGSIYAENLAGAVSLQQATVSMTHSQFLSNFNAENGGAVEMRNNANFLCMECEFEENRSARNGGAVFVTHDSVLRLLTTVFRRNQAEQGSVAFFVDTSGTNSLISGCSLSVNSTESAVLVLLSAHLTLLNIDLNTGRILTVASVLSVLNTVFVNSTEIEAVAGSQISLMNCSMSAGHIGVVGSEVRAIMSYFRGCDEVCICAKDASTVSISNSTFEEFTQGGMVISNSNASITYSTVQNYLGTAIEVNSQSEVSISASSFVSGTTDSNGAGIQLSNSHCQVSMCEFRELKANLGGAVWAHGTQSTEMTISDSEFRGNKANEGGGIWAGQALIELTKVVFEGNQAEQGGAAYFDCENDCGMVIRSCRLEDNSASIAGGGIRWTHTKPQINFVSFQQNSSPYGSNFGSYASKIVGVDASGALIDRIPTTPLPLAMSLRGLTSGTSTEFTLALLDSYGYTVRVDNSTECWVTAIDSTLVLLQGVKRVKAQLGRCYFSDLRVTASPGYSFYIIASGTNLPSVYINLNIRNCTSGEEVRNKQCYRCGAGSFSLEAGSACKVCPTGGNCYGGDSLLPKPGYWRSVNQSEEIYSCLHSEACVGVTRKQENNMEMCGEGYDGQLCGACKTDYVRSGFGQCRECRNEAVYIVILSLSSLFVFILVYKSTKLPNSQSQAWFKLLLSHIQLLLLLTSFNLNWPQPLTSASQTLSKVLLLPEQALSNQCFYHFSIDSDSSLSFIRRVVTAMVLPFIVTIGVLCILSVRHCVSRSLAGLRSEVGTSVLILLYMTGPSQAMVLFESWGCVRIEGNYWLAANTLIRCHQGFTFFALGAALLWVGGVPGFGLYLLCMLRNHRNSQWFLTAGYHADLYYWEFVLYGVKIALAALAGFLPAYPILQSSLGLLTLVSMLYFQLCVSPGLTPQLQQTALLSFESLCLLQWVVLVLHIYEAGEWMWLVCFSISTGVFLIGWLARSWWSLRPLFSCYKNNEKADDFSRFILLPGRNLSVPSRLDFLLTLLKVPPENIIPSLSPRIKYKNAHLYGSPAPSKPKRKRSIEVTTDEVVLEESKAGILPVKHRHNKLPHRYRSQDQASKGIFNGDN